MVLSSVLAVAAAPIAGTSQAGYVASVLATASTASVVFYYASILLPVGRVLCRLRTVVAGLRLARTGSRPQGISATPDGSAFRSPMPGPLPHHQDPGMAGRPPVPQRGVQDLPGPPGTEFVDDRSVQRRRPSTRQQRCSRSTRAH
jgi:hypothetical protein